MDAFMESRLAAFYTKGPGGSLLKEAGDIIKRPDLAATLDSIAEGGADVFYKGRIAEDIVNAVRN